MSDASRSTIESTEPAVYDPEELLCKYLSPGDFEEISNTLYMMRSDRSESVRRALHGLAKELERLEKRNAELKSKVEQFDAFLESILALEPHLDKPKPHVEALLDKAKEAICLKAEIDQIKADRDHLQKFKDYVHQRLDEAGIPQFSDEKCRVGARLTELVSRMYDNT
jgi:chromosome segregation ATPase